VKGKNVFLSFFAYVRRSKQRFPLHWQCTYQVLQCGPTE
jgi:hypothetical protein